MRSASTLALFLGVSSALLACQPGVIVPDPGETGGSSGQTTSSSQSTSSDTQGCDKPADCPPAVGSGLPQAVAIDAKGNVLVVSERIVLGSASPSAFDVTKKDAQGKVLWSLAYGAGAGIGGYRLSAAVDAAGNLMVAGEMAKSGDFGSVHLSAVGSGDAFVLQIDPDGYALWGRTFGTTDTHTVSDPDGGGQFQAPEETGAASVSVGPDGTVFLSGMYQGHVDFGKGTLDGGDQSSFVIALDGKDGSTKWATDLGKAFFPLVAGEPGGGAIVASSFEMLDGVILSGFDATGAQLWKKSFPGSQVGPQGIGADAMGNVFVTGGFTSIGFGMGSLQGIGSPNTFLVKVSPDGTIAWAEPLNGPGFIANSRVAVAPSGGAVLAAECDTTASLGGMSVSSKMGVDICLVRVDASGKATSTSVYGTPNHEQLQDMALTPQGAAYVVGDSLDNSPDRVGFEATVSF